MGAILYGILVAHLMAYKEQYANIGVMFAMSTVIKLLVKSSGAKDQSDLIGIGGGALTIGEVIKLLKEIQKGGSIGSANPVANPNGLLGEILDAVKGVVVK